MTFCNGSEVKESISRYVICRGVLLKFVKNEPTRMQVICEDGCPILLLVSKDSSNFCLKVKTLVSKKFH